jgi:hypothetical protein
MMKRALILFLLTVASLIFVACGPALEPRGTDTIGCGLCTG